MYLLQYDEGVVVMCYPLCNGKASRAPCLLGHTFILCWRCTGLVCGSLVGYALSYHTGMLGTGALLFLVPVGVDGIAQYGFGYESTNRRRFVTGLVGGLSYLFGAVI